MNYEIGHRIRLVTDYDKNKSGSGGGTWSDWTEALKAGGLGTITDIERVTDEFDYHVQWDYDEGATSYVKEEYIEPLHKLIHPLLINSPSK